MDYRMTPSKVKQFIQKIILFSKSLRKGTLTLIIFLLIAFLIRVFLIEFYEISSSSMEPTLMQGDIILVCKMSYGARLFNPFTFFTQKKIKYVRTKGWSLLKKGDIFTFNMPLYNNYIDSTANIYGDCVIKRTLGLPGNTVLIKYEKSKIEGDDNIKEGKTLFPHDNSLAWSLNNYGPLHVPAKGEKMELTKRTVIWYKDILLYENPTGYIKDSLLFIDNKAFLLYTFQHNYYFMLGDNFFNSQDSRYWGFLPDGNIIGKAIIVLFSINQNQHGLKKIRSKRFMKLI